VPWCCSREAKVRVVTVIWVLIWLPAVGGLVIWLLVAAVCK